MERRFQNIFKELRQEKGLTQAQLADILNYTQGNISGWESGAVEPKASALIIIANFFNVTIEYLLGISDDFEKSTIKTISDTSTEQERELLRYFRELSPYLKGMTLDAVKSWAKKSGDDEQKKA